MSELNIEDLKCCGNCKNFYYPICIDKKEKVMPFNVCHKWKFDNIKYKERKYTNE